MVPVHNVSVESTTAVTFLEVRAAQDYQSLNPTTHAYRQHPGYGSPYQLLGRRTNIRLVSYPSFFTSPCIQLMLADGTIGAISTNATEAAAQLEGMDVYFAEVSSPPKERNFVAFSSAFDPGPLEVPHRRSWALDGDHDQLNQSRRVVVGRSANSVPSGSTLWPRFSTSKRSPTRSLATSAMSTSATPTMASSTYARRKVAVYRARERRAHLTHARRHLSYRMLSPRPTGRSSRGRRTSTRTGRTTPSTGRSRRRRTSSSSPRTPVRPAARPIFIALCPSLPKLAPSYSGLHRRPRQGAGVAADGPVLRRE